MGSPPQGYIANQLTVRDGSHSYVMKGDGSGDLGVFLDGTRVWMFSPDWGFTILNDFAYFALNTPSQAIRREITNIDNTYDSKATAGWGLPAIYGIDKRYGVSSADGAPVTLYAIPVLPTNKLYRVTIDIFATAVSAGTATYTLTWTQNAVTRTLAVSASVLNTLATGTDLINPDISTNVTVQLTFAGFVGTLDIAAVLEQLG